VPDASNRHIRRQYVWPKSRNTKVVNGLGNRQEVTRARTCTLDDSKTFLSLLTAGCIEVHWMQSLPVKEFHR
jgi:hypothetical protein